MLLSIAVQHDSSRCQKWYCAHLPTFAGVSPTVSPGPGVSLPTLPGGLPVVTTPGGSTTNTTLPPGTKGSLEIRTGWALGDDNANCYKWNGTELVEDLSTTVGERLRCLSHRCSVLLPSPPVVLV